MNQHSQRSMPPEWTMTRGWPAEQSLLNSPTKPPKGRREKWTARLWPMKTWGGSAERRSPG